MRVIAQQQENSIVCEFPSGDEVEIIMVSAEGEDYCNDLDLESAPKILEKLGNDIQGYSSNS